MDKKKNYNNISKNDIINDANDTMKKILMEYEEVKRSIKYEYDENQKYNDNQNDITIDDDGQDYSDER